MYIYLHIINFAYLYTFIFYIIEEPLPETPTSEPVPVPEVPVETEEIDGMYMHIEKNISMHFFICMWSHMCIYYMYMSTSISSYIYYR
jgi:hypothetical protein